MRRLVDSQSQEIIAPRDSSRFRINGGDFFVTGKNNPYYLLEEGKVIAYNQFPEAGPERRSREVCLGLYSSWSLLGEPLGKVKHPYTKRIRAVSNEAVFRVIQRGGQIADPDDRVLLIRASDQDKTTQENHITLMTQSNHLRYKVAWALLALTSPEDREVPTSQQVIADLTASARISVNAVMRSFEEAGILSNSSASYSITAPDGIKQLVSIVESLNPYLLP